MTTFETVILFLMISFICVLLHIKISVCRMFGKMEKVRDEHGICLECSCSGNHYFINDAGEPECYCPHCSIYKQRMIEEEENE